MFMKTKTIIEEPIFSIEKPYGETFKLYASDLKAAEVGQKWVTENQDQYPNRRYTWDEIFQVVYKNDRGVAILYHVENTAGGDYWEEEEQVELIWVELH